MKKNLLFSIFVALFGLSASFAHAQSLRIDTRAFDRPVSADTAKDGTQIWYGQYSQSLQIKKSGDKALILLIDYLGHTGRLDTLIGINMHRSSKKEPWIVDTVGLAVWGKKKILRIYPSQAELDQILSKIYAKMAIVKKPAHPGGELKELSFFEYASLEMKKYD